jgi:hypothetical protein
MNGRTAPGFAAAWAEKAINLRFEGSQDINSSFSISFMKLFEFLNPKLKLP